MLLTNWLKVLSGSRTRNRRSQVVRRARRRAEMPTGSAAPIRTESLETRTLLTATNPLPLGGLNGANGVIINGPSANDISGASVNGIGDVNADGFEDVIVSAPGGDAAANDAGEVYVLFGKSGGFATGGLNLSSLSATDGFRIDGATGGQRVGAGAGVGNPTVSSAGDFNGDGFGDIIIGAPLTSGNTGAAYVLFGKSSFTGPIDLGSLGATDGFQINGIDAGDFAGHAVGSAGDINGDGLDDVVIGAYGADGPAATYDAGEAYVVLGQTSNPGTTNLSALNGTNGFRFNGIDAYDFTGVSVDSAGDVNGDGLDDLIIGGVDGTNYNGESYLIYGKTSAFASSIDLSGLTATDGTVLSGNAGERAGISVAGAGDVNGDGIADLLIGGDYGNGYAGRSYVVFGADGGLGATFSLGGVNGTTGFAIQGVGAYDFSGRAVSAVGDVNGDGFDDIQLGAYNADYNNTYGSEAPGTGRSYVVFGASTFGATFALSSLNGDNGFRLDGENQYDVAGQAVGGAGDVNGDGFDDAVVGAPMTDVGLETQAGRSYLVFGGNFNTAANTVIAGDANANILNASNGSGTSDRLVGAQGNDTLNSDGGADVLIGGQGDDVLGLDIDNLGNNFQIDGGSGTDTLLLGGTGAGNPGTFSGNLDLTGISDALITDIEVIDLNDGNTNTLTLNLNEVLNISSTAVGLSDTGNFLDGTSNALVIRREGSDMIVDGGGWTDAGTTVIAALGGATFDVLTQGNATLLIEQVDGVEIAVSPASQGEESGAALTYTFTRPVTTGAITINFSVSGTATNVTDYVLAGAASFNGTTGTVTMADGVGTAMFTVTPVGDDGSPVVEEDETVIVTVDAGAGYSVGSPNMATGTITDNDTAEVSITGNMNGAETDTPTAGQFTVNLSNPSSTDTTVSYNVGGTATSGTDFAALSGSVTIDAGDTSATIDVTVLNDAIVEVTETVLLTLTAVTAGDAGITLAADPNDADSIDITDDDTATLSIAGTTNGAEAATPTNGQFTVTQSAVATTDTVVNFSVSGGTATSDDDFTAFNGMATIMAGQTTATIDVPVLNDALVEGTETVEVTLDSINSGDADVTIDTGNDDDTVDIADNDTASITFNPTTQTTNEEDAAMIDVTLELTITADTGGTPMLAQSVSVDVTENTAVAAGNATDGADFTDNTPTTVMFSAGAGNGATAMATNVVTIINDGDIEDNEDIDLTVAINTDNTGGQVTATGTHTVTILDDDTPRVVILNEGAANSNTDLSAANESETLTYTVSRETGADVTLTVEFAITGSAGSTDFAVSGTGVTYDSGTGLGSISLPMGSNEVDITVTPMDDNIVEGDETVIVTLMEETTGPNYNIGSPAAQTGTISDIDTANVAISAPTITETDANQTVTFDVTLDAPVAGGFDVAIGSALGTAEMTDFNLVTTSVTFGDESTATQSVSVTIVGDQIVEIDETFDISLGAITNTTLGARINTGGPATGTIQNDDTATVSVSAPTITGDTGQTVNFTVSVDAEVEGGFDVNFSSALDANTEAGDLTVNTVSPVTFAGTSSTETQNISVTITDDMIVEDAETFTITLDSTNNANVSVSSSNGSATGTITNDDTATLSISAAAANQTEGDGGTADVIYTISLDNPVEGGFDVAVGTSGSATLTDDFTISGSSVTFGDADTGDKTVTVSINGDTVVEDNETVTVTLGDVTNTSAVQDAAITTGASDSTTIDNDDAATLTITADASPAMEGDSGTQDVTYTVSVDAAVQGGFTVALNSSGSADSSDFSLSGSSVTFAGTAGEMETFTLSVNGDETVELDETATITLGTVSGTSSEQAGDIATGASDSTTITNDDSATVSITGVSQDEGAAGTTTTFAFAVDLSAAVDTAVTADFADQAGASNPATAGDDYVDPSGTVTFTASSTATQTINVTVNGDADIEEDELFEIVLSNLMAGGRNVTFAGGMATETATGTILNDESDYGDAPDGNQFVSPTNYPTLAANNGARHILSASRVLQLGDLVDAEADGQPTAAADGDDNNGVDDGDGVVIFDLIRADNVPSAGLINVDARLGGGSGFLTGWIDFNRDGDFTDDGEKIVDDVALAEGINALTITVPFGTDAVAGTTFARFRISDAIGTTAAGLAAGSGIGEVEDYQVTIQDAGNITPVDMTVMANAGANLTATFESGNIVIRDGATVVFSQIDGAINTLFIEGTDAGDETLTVDFVNGDPVPVGGIVFNGGTLMGGGDNDTLNVVNTDAAGIISTTIDYTNPTDGVITESNGTDSFLITFTGLDPLTHSATQDLVLNLPDTVDNATLTSAGGGQNTLTSNSGTFETTTFANPTGSLTINAGGGGDTITVTSLDAGFAATLTINGEDGDDVLTADGLGTAVAINGNAGADSITGGTAGDVLVGGTGNDTIEGMDGDDTLTGNGGDDSLLGGSGTTTLQETALPNLTLTTAATTTTITGNGTDTLEAASAVAVITGTSGNNNIDADGFIGAVTISGGAGNDTIRGSASNADELDGGDGVDRVVLKSGGGNFTVVDGSSTDDNATDTFQNVEQVRVVGDTVAINFDASAYTEGSVHVIGSSANDAIIGGQGNDFLNGRAGMDTVMGGPGADTILGGNDADELDGQEGNDVVRGQGGDDTLGGGAGDDRIEGGAGNNTLQEAVDADITIRSTNSGARLSGVGNDFISGMTSFIIMGGSSNNRLDASQFDGPVTLAGGDGDDTLLGSRGADSLDGGSGTDEIQYTVNARTNIVTDTMAGGDVISGIEGIRVTVARRQGALVDASAFTGNATITGAQGPDTLIGGSGRDRLNGKSGNDVIEGNGNVDRLFGGSGRDILRGGDGNDILRGHRGDDTLAGGAGNDRLIGNKGRLILSEVADLDLTVNTVNGAARIVGNGTDNVNGNVTGVLLVGGDSANVLNAANSPVAVTLQGGGGDDTLLGSVFSDRLEGGEGTDVVQQTVDRNQFLTDTQVTGLGTDRLTSIEGGVLIGGAGNNRLNATGFSGSVTLVGNAGNDTLQGSNQSDVLDGGAGNDSLVGGQGNDTMRGGDGDDVLQGGFGNDVLLGSAGNDTLDGGENNDSLLGEDGDDSVDGNLGVDEISGGGNGSAVTAGDIAADASEINDAIMFTNFDDLLMGIV